MEKYKLEKITLASYIKLNAIGSFTMGLIFGLFMFVVSLFNGDAVYLTINDNVMTGIKAGVGGLFLSPILSCIVFTIFTTFMYAGIFLYLKIKKSINIEGNINKI